MVIVAHRIWWGDEQSPRVWLPMGSILSGPSERDYSIPRHWLENTAAVREIIFRYILHLPDGSNHRLAQ